MDELTEIPGIGDQTAGNIVVDRPHESVGAVSAEIDLDRFLTVTGEKSAD
jgi:radical SAM superfamily enzyme with C-terminal helix-hairpin-helix motif